MKKKSKRKYANGTGGIGTSTTNFIESPYTALAENQIMMANADLAAQTNPWAAGLGLIGQAGLNYGLSGISGGLNQLLKPVAANGMNDASGQIEAEGGELVETPGGIAEELIGPDHEEGGIDMDVPDGTVIYSDRIKKDGKTMAERKKIREAKKINLEKLLEKNKTDLANKNAYDRAISNLDAQEQADLEIQEMANAFTQMQGFAMGTSKRGVQIYANGGITGNPLYSPLGYDPILEQQQALLAGDQIRPQAQYAMDPNLTSAGPTTPLSATDLNPNIITNTVVPDLASLPQQSRMGGFGFTPGDITGLIGNAISTFGSMKNTLQNRAGDTPNINAFQNFGKDALAANEKAKGYVSSQRDNTLKGIRSNALSAQAVNRNSARGVNTMRALDLATNAGVNKATGDVNDAFAKQIMSLFGTQAQLENAQDQAVMTGENIRNLNDRKDRDNFYSQKAKDISTMGKGFQQTGKDLNQVTQNDMMMNILNQMGKYFKFDKNGQIIGINS